MADDHFTISTGPDSFRRETTAENLQGTETCSADTVSSEPEEYDATIFPYIDPESSINSPQQSYRSAGSVNIPPDHQPLAVIDNVTEATLPSATDSPATKTRSIKNGTSTVMKIIAALREAIERSRDGIAVKTNVAGACFAQMGWSSI